MNAMFLDCEGVLAPLVFLAALGIHSEHSFKNWRYYAERVDPAKAAIVRDFFVKTKCRIVFTSSWRSMNDVCAFWTILRKHGFKLDIDDVDATPLMAGASRADEIQAYLDSHPEIKKFVIFDDMPDMGHLKSQFIQVDPYLGIEQKDIERALTFV